jgi:multicomponent Na+:H+ antiporter subunit E
MRVVRTFALLFAIWVLWSGHSEPLLLGLGLASCAVVIWLGVRLGALEGGGRTGFLVRGLGYAPWLLFEIVKSNFAVARIILGRELRVDPRLVRVRASQRTAFGQVAYANSITLTPGTISLDLRDDRILVHALSADFERDLRSGEMDRRVAALEAGRR